MNGARRGAAWARLVRGILARLFAVGFGILLAATIAELGTRAFAPQRTGPVELTYDRRVGSIPVPNRRGTVTVPGVYQYTFTNDPLGLRVTGVVDRVKAGVRVLLLGDSFTYGTGVNDSQTFAHGLEERFARDGLSVAVINAGNSGKGTAYALRFMETIGRTLNSDLAVLCFFPNDFRDNVRTYVYKVGSGGTLTVNPGLGKVYRQKEILNRLGVYNWLVSWSHLANAIKQASIRLVRARIHANEGDAVAFVPETGRHITKTTTAVTNLFLKALVRETRVAGTGLMVAYIPRSGDINRFREGRGLSPEETVLRRLVPPGVPFVSLTSTIAASPHPVEVLYFDEGRTGRYDGHWTGVAHGLAAGALEQPIKELLKARRVAGR